jgi:hypothetical protein
MENCSHCDSKILEGEFKYVSRKNDCLLCNDCYSEHTTTCENCSQTTYPAEDCLETEQGDVFCQYSCLQEYGGGQCYACDSTTSHVRYSDTAGEEYCEDCYEDLEDEDADDEEEFEFIPEKRNGVMNTNNRYVGVELEVIDEGRTIERGTGYKIVADGSLNDNGREIVSDPLMNNRFEYILKNLISYYKDDVEIDSSCGFHLHIGLKNKEINSLAFHKKLIAFAKNNEHLFFTILPRSRHDNHYAKMFNSSEEDFRGLRDDIKKLNDSKTRLRFVEQLYCSNSYSQAHKRYKQSIRNLAIPNKSKDIRENYECAIDSAKRGRGKYGDNNSSRSSAYRYKWLNFHSIQYRGTIEVRLHTGTFNYNKVKAWTLLWVNLIDYISTKPLRYIQNKKFNSIDEMIGVLKIASRRVGTSTLRHHYKKRVSKFKSDYTSLSNYYNWNMTDEERATLYFINQMDRDDRDIRYTQRIEQENREFRARHEEQEGIENV